eukprot:316285-Chlamydomonas_euryale.AAC.3
MLPYVLKTGGVPAPWTGRDETQGRRCSMDWQRRNTGPRLRLVCRRAAALQAYSAHGRVIGP